VVTAPLLLVGCGKMGGALLSGWLQRGVAAAEVSVVEPAGGANLDAAREAGVNVLASAADVPRDLAPAVVLFAVKPQVMDEVVPSYRHFVGAETAFLSIAAGKTIASFERHLGGGAAIVRAMPNTPAAVGRGITVLCANANVSTDRRDTCGELLAAVGAIAWVDDESLMDAVTGLSGSGPAYVFLLIECLTQAGIDAGLPADLAGPLARATVAGAGELARLSDESAATLRQNVTSPGGTTKAALEVLMAEDGLGRLMSRAVAAATRRSAELAN
jgi:pyrroline-5-carboxylate reductase